MKLQFCGAAQMVTGSNYLLESGKTRILIDCGLFQGSNYCDDLNFEPFPYDPKTIDAVLVTHGHIDHIGRVPKLVRAGFRGKIYSTPPTKDSAEFLLLDSEHVLREEALNHKRTPMYDIEDVNNAMKLWQKVSYHEKFSIGDFQVEFYDAGHVLGSAFVVLEAEGKRIVFSGDLGNPDTPFIHPLEKVTDVDYLITESTYGNSIHPSGASRTEALEDVIEEISKNKGVLVIPAFALERTQEMIYEIDELVRNNRIPKIPVFIDSPLAIKLTSVYQKYSTDPKYFRDEAIDLIRHGDALFNFPGLRLTLTTEQSKEIREVMAPKVVVAGSGMSHGGRILFHERDYLGDAKNGILFVGYQAKNSLGRIILEGAETVHILGQMITVKAKKYEISSYSAHADQPGILAWIEPMKKNLKKVFLTHGELEQQKPLAQKILDEYALPTNIPSLNDTVVL